MAAPNGARRGKADHPQIPLTTDEIVRTAVAVAAAGASALHLHVRDAAGNHSLCPDIYRQTLAAITESCGDQLLVQITTEAVGVFTVQQQIDLVRTIQPEAVSLSVRELGRAEPAAIADLDGWMRTHQVLPQWIVYDKTDLDHYQSWLEDGVLCGSAYPLLLVLGRYRGDAADAPQTLTMCEQVEAVASSWMACAFGHREQEVMAEVMQKGGHARVGFENNLWRADQTLAQDNAELVSTTVKTAQRQGRPLALIDEARDLLTPEW